jgi:hypothetical protein
MTSNHSTDNNSGSASPWTRPGFLFAGGFAVLVVALLIVVLVMTSGGGGGKIGQAQPAPATAGSATATSPSTVDEGPTTVPTAPPAGVTWQLYHTVALPFSTQAGPRHVTDSTATGYAHTPTGALLAAAQIPIRKLIAPDWQAVVAQQVVPGPGRDAFSTVRARVTDATPTPGELSQFAGFKFVNYSPNLATIQFVSRFVSGTLQVATITVQWQAGDWKEVLQPDGGDSPTAQAVQNLIGYVQWGGI